MNLATQIGENIKHLLKSAGVSQAEMARRLKIPRGTFITWLRGDGAIPKEVIIKIAHDLEVDYSEIDPTAMDSWEEDLYQLHCEIDQEKIKEAKVHLKALKELGVDLQAFDTRGLYDKIQQILRDDMRTYFGDHRVVIRDLLSLVVIYARQDLS